MAGWSGILKLTLSSGAELKPHGGRETCVRPIISTSRLRKHWGSNGRGRSQVLRKDQT